MPFELDPTLSLEFMALIDLTEAQTERHLAALTIDINQFGCSVKTTTPFPEGTKLRLRIWHTGSNFVPKGEVVPSQRQEGRRIAFTTIEPGSQPILEGWLANLKKHAMPARLRNQPQ